jgi:hypothetical protein
MVLAAPLDGAARSAYRHITAAWKAAGIADCGGRATAGHRALGVSARI